MAYLQRRVDGAWIDTLDLDVAKITRLGRSKVNDIVVDDPHCSRCQAEMYFDNGQWIVRDVGSQNGTIVSGDTVSGSCPIKHGDVLRLGECEFLMCLQDTPRQEVGSVSAWMQKLQTDSDGNDSAPQAQLELWKRYYDRLTRLASRKLGGVPRRIADEDDAVVDAFNSFFGGVQQGRFPKLEDRDDLWKVLATITTRKVCRHIERETAQKRGGGHVAGESVFAGPQGAGSMSSERHGIENVVQGRTDSELLVEFEDTWQRYVKNLPDDLSRQIVELRLAGFPTNEIAEQVGVSLSTVERRLRTIREVWDQQFADEANR